jgi:hypothetical protein
MVELDWSEIEVVMTMMFVICTPLIAAILLDALVAESTGGACLQRAFLSPGREQDPLLSTLGRYHRRDDSVVAHNTSAPAASSSAAPPPYAKREDCHSTP